MQPSTATARISSPLGIITLEADNVHLLGVRLPRDREMTGELQSAHPLLAEAAAQISAWFDGRLTDFDLPLLPLNTDDGQRLRDSIAAIPYGETMTYGVIGARVGAIARAVGQACKTNPYPLIIPCHRVVSTSGPEYYSAGNGPRTKTWLLDFEYDHLPPEQRTRLI